MNLLSVTLLVLCCSLSFSQEKVNPRPIVGIYTNPSGFKSYPITRYQTITATYVQFIEGMGAQAVFIPYDSSTELLDTLFSKVNGILFQGGNQFNSNFLKSINLASKHSVEKIFIKNAAYLINKAKSANDDGDFFPIWAVCQGFELLTLIESGMDFTILSKGYDDTGSHNVQQVDRKSKLFSKMPEYLIKWMEEQPSIFFHHDLGIVPTNFIQNSLLNQFYKITSVSENKDNKDFVATIEANKYPIYGLQYHPEKNIYDWNSDAPHDFNSKGITEYYQHFFGNLTIQSTHSFEDKEEESKYLVSKFKVHNFKKSQYKKVYIIPNQKNPDVDYDDYSKNHQLMQEYKIHHPFLKKVIQNWP